jgi:hypothetical protein
MSGAATGGMLQKFRPSLTRDQDGPSGARELQHGACARLDLRVNLEWGLGEPAISLEEQFSAIASYIALLIEAGAVLVVAFGAV